jgi:flavin-dependent dehydrogenase
MNKNIVIVGGVAGGATAAARLRRLDEFAEIILFERGGLFLSGLAGSLQWELNPIEDPVSREFEFGPKRAEESCIRSALCRELPSV